MAIRHVANQNGVSSLANFGDLPPTAPTSNPSESHPEFMSDHLNEKQYRCVFNSLSVGMAITTMGGSFIDCNAAFTKLSSYSKQELKATTIFNLTSREDLQGAFDMMSQLITPSNFKNEDDSKPPVVLRSNIKNRSDLGLSVSLIRGEDGVARYFNVTLVKLPTSSSSGLGNVKPIPATVDMMPPTEAATAYSSQPVADQMISKSGYDQNMNSPRYTSG